MGAETRTQKFYKVDLIIVNMKKAMIIWITLIILIIVIGIYLIMSKQPDANINNNINTNADQSSNEILIQDFSFSPSILTIKAGQNVIWKNKDSSSHTIVSDTGKEIESSGLLKDQTYAHTFDTPGTYNYHCSIHPSMKGKVIVQ